MFEKVRFASSGVAVLAAAASIAVAGIVGFVGLIVPHVVCNIVGSDGRHRQAGHHDSFPEAGGFYATLWRAQAGNVDGLPDQSLRIVAIFRPA